MDKARLGSVLVFVLAGASAAACGGSRQKEANVARGVTKAPTTCPTNLKTVTQPIGRTGSSATLALAKVDGHRVVFVADEDAKAILTLDLDTGAELAQTSLGAAPAHVYVANDGRIFTTLRDKAEVVLLDATRADAPLHVLCGATTPSEPIAIGGSPDDA